jgi:hypothetical protein
MPILAALLTATPALAQNAAPVAADASFLIEPGQQIQITLQATDANGDALSFIITTLPAKGSVTVGSTTLAAGNLPYTLPNNEALLTYTAASSDHAANTIKFKATDGTDESAVATITVQVNQPPTISSDPFFTEPSTDLKISLPVQDPDKDKLTYSILTLSGHGRLKSGTATLTDSSLPFSTEKADVTYTPDAEFHGPDSFTLTATDGFVTTSTVTVSIQVNTTPVPENLSATVVPGGTRTITLVGVDADKDALQYEIVSLPAHGSLAVAGKTIAAEALPFALSAGKTEVVYKVEAGYSGTDSFHFRVTDGVSTSDRAVVTIAVNTAPLAPSMSLVTKKDTAVESALEASDADGDVLTVRITRLPASGTLKLDGKAVTKTDAEYELPADGLTFSYTPAKGLVGSDSFGWVANDGREDSASAEVEVIIEAPTETSPTPPPTDTAPPPATSPSDDSGGDGFITDPFEEHSDDEVLGTPPEDEEVAPACGPAGAAELVILAVSLWIATARNRDVSRPVP